MDLPPFFTSTSIVLVSDFPPTLDAQLLALTIRHRRRNDIYSLGLREILHAFNAAGIDAVVLKGAALAHVLYPAVGLRPMSDIDLLVDPRLTRRAQVLLAELGFAAVKWRRCRRSHRPLQSSPPCRWCPGPYRSTPRTSCLRA